MTAQLALSGPNMHVEGTSASGVRHTQHPRSFTPKLHDIQIGTFTSQNAVSTVLQTRLCATSVSGVAGRACCLFCLRKYP